MFGNIGVPQRLTFSVIGPTVNEVSRIETMTNAVETGVLTTGLVASHNPELWTSKGKHRLQGVSNEIELFTLKELEGKDFVSKSKGAVSALEQGTKEITIN
jgi:adenylate cyclase